MSRPKKPPRRARRVLIIEDNADAAESLRLALETSDLEVTVASDGPEGLAQAKRLVPDAVLCDIGLPSMTGYDVAAALRADEALAKSVLIALTGFSLPEDLRRAKRAGFDHQLAKPPDFEYLEKLIAGIRAN